MMGEGTDVTTWKWIMPLLKGVEDIFSDASVLSDHADHLYLSFIKRIV